MTFDLILAKMGELRKILRVERGGKLSNSEWAAAHIERERERAQANRDPLTLEL